MRTLALALAFLLGNQTALALDPNEYTARRTRLAKAIGSNSIFIALSSRVATRNGDVSWPFRQDDNLLYLTGVTTPDTTLVLLPGETEYSENLFTPNGQQEGASISRQTAIRHVEPVWRFRWFLDAAFSGTPWGPSETDAVYRPAGMPAFSEAIKDGRAEVWMLLGSRSRTDEDQSPEERLAAELRRRFPEIRVRDAWPLLIQLRQMKSAREIDLIQRATDITVLAEKAAMRRALAATHEYQIQATVEATFRENGACCWAFPSIVAAGRNALTPHYFRNDAPISKGDLIVVDIGAEIEGYASDVARTFPAGGSFAPDQAALYNVVLAAHEESMRALKPGATLRDAYEKGVDVLSRGLLSLGLITKNERAQIRWYVPSTAGHQVGLNVHDVFDRARKLEPGMVVTNEPAIYVAEDDVRGSPVFRRLSSQDQQRIEAALKKYGGIGIRIEDTFVITAEGARMLSSGAPATKRDIEEWMK